MKKLYRYGLGAALLVSALGASAQNRAADSSYPLGSRQALVRQLQADLATDLAQRAAPTVELRVAANQAFTGKVNYRQDLANTGTLLVGELQGIPNSSFLLRLADEEVEGQIVLKNTRQAYSYTADKQGTVTVQAVDINKVVCIDYNQPVGYREPAPAAGTANRATVVSLQSLPGARGCVMLDFDGYALPAGTRWNNGNAYNAPSANMTDANIQAFWELVSEDFRPFSLNVTTDEAVFNAYPKNMRMRCVVSPGSGSTIAPGSGGVAYVTSFRYNDDTPCWVFMSAPKSGGEAASHEVGHTLGLSHDGRISPSEGYYTGQDNSGAWAPIMGAGYYKPVTHWSRGEYNSANNTQDDLAIMAGTTYNVGYRTDDHSNTTTGATALTRNGTSLAGSGLIERTTDQDYFSFSTGGGSVSLNVSTVSRYGNLDLVARLFNSGGTQVGSFDTSGGGNLNVSFTTTLAAGTYYVQVDGTGSGNPATDGYSDYGSLGTFSISGTAPAPVTTANVATLYKHCSYGGTTLSLPVGDYTLAALQSRGFLNDDLSSVQVNSGYEVVLYENDNYTGSALTLRTATSCLTGNALGSGTWNDVATSVRVRPATAAINAGLQADAANASEALLAEQVSLYPNPVTDRVTVQGAQLAGSTYQVLDAYGQLRSQGTLGQPEVDLSALPAGVYRLVVITPQQQKISRQLLKR
ncbi:T9SS type A sorting domain-containing protein [Hymenobacter sp. BT186]|uniref:T9SS type A sorting domain-containing protein n=1 Tax=Hymenobacter telluris TaxID=2816474 RepID=A0A939F1R3_9BACT|nr:T9SS type A sorting domain-containing protein [Hymenobacter telluris]MBO0361157.1 T9SS type A sorting domain-containing protein [Hymenobacter telluris]MBW3377185.1 T9SS type A sorting domain-containing protein [Hymenobacter norwichensis]